MGVTRLVTIVAGILLGISSPGTALALAEPELCCSVANLTPQEWVFSCPKGIQAKVRAGADHQPAALIRLPGAFEAPTDIGTYFTPANEAAVVRGELANVSVELVAVIRDRTPLLALSFHSPEGVGTTFVQGESSHECLPSLLPPTLSSIVSQSGLSPVYASGSATPARLVYDRLFGGR